MNDSLNFLDELLAEAAANKAAKRAEKADRKAYLKLVRPKTETVSLALVDDWINTHNVRTVTINNCKGCGNQERFTHPQLMVKRIHKSKPAQVFKPIEVTIPSLPGEFLYMETTIAECEACFEISIKNIRKN